MKKTTIAAAAFAAAGVATASQASAQTSVLTPTNDTYVQDGLSYTATGPSNVLNSIVQRVPYIQFDMSGLNIDEISSATVTLTKADNGSRNDTLVTGRLSLQGLLEIDGNTLQAWDETEEFVPGADPSVPPNGLDFRNVGAEWDPSAPDGVDFSRLFNLDADTGANVTEAVAGGTVATVTGIDLVTFLNSRADASGLVTFLLPFPDGTSDNRGLGYQSKEGAIAPTLTLTYTTAIPEPTTAVALAGLGGLTLLRRRRA